MGSNVRLRHKARGQEAQGLVEHATDDAAIGEGMCAQDLCAGHAMLSPADFAGAWTLNREIIDHSGAMSGTLVGKADFARGDADTFMYRENGVLQLARGGHFTAQRTYVWRWEAARVVVTFADGAAFHEFVPEGMGAGTAHLCGADLYNVTYDFSAWPRWEAAWKVQGPRKDYTSVTVYTRA